MDPTYYHELHTTGHGTHGFPGSYPAHHPFDRYPHDVTDQAMLPGPAAMLPSQYTTVWDTRDGLRQIPGPPSMIPFIDPMSSSASESGSGPRLGAQPVGFYPAQPQPAWPPHMETSAPNTASGIEDEGEPQTRSGHTSRELVPQEAYKPVRQQKELGASQTIEFSVYGMEGIRLSDALEENWVGFKGQDDRPSFGDERVQIMIRLQFVGCPPWRSKVYTTDHTSRRQPIARTKLAYEVAKNVKKYLEREKANGHDGHSRCSWGDVSLGNLYLTRLIRVSNASWQPELFVATAMTAASLSPS